MKNLQLIAILMCLATTIFAQQAHNLIIDTKQPIAEVAPTMWGIFFEDINFAADGGIYAELVKNRSFEFNNPMVGWKPIELDINKGELLPINRSGPDARNPRFMRISKTNSASKFGLSNEGFRGMGFRQGETYHFYIKTCKQQNDLSLTVELINAEGNSIGMAQLEGFTNEWKEYTVSLTASETVEKGGLRILFEGDGAIDIDMVSLFPENTWKNRPKGLRKDLIELLDGLNPGFVRFPGGCIVEGYDLINRYQWKNTVGPIEDRKLIKSRWMDEFRHRMAPDYYQSYGIGFYEYFLLSEDLGAEPLPILNCGMACQFNSKEVAAMDDLGPYIQDALDLIEFANGGRTTTWGKLRTEMGHPEPFHLKYLGIGNEQWGPQYIERYAEFHKILKEKHPEIKLISAAGPTTDERNAYLWEELKKLNAEIIDEHYYKPPQWFLENATRYDSFDRNGPKVFAGEYASHVNTNNKAPEARNNWQAALTEAAFMTSLERNADVVTMTAYAPLFAHKEAWQWNPDMIWFNNLEAMPTPNYLVQQTFSLNSGDRVLSITENGQPLTGQQQLYSSVSINDKTNTLLVKLVNTSEQSKQVTLNTKGAKIKAGETVMVETISGSFELYNELGGKNNFEKQVVKINGISALSNIEIKPYSLNVVKIELRK